VAIDIARVAKVSGLLGFKASILGIKVRML